MVIPIETHRFEHVHHHNRPVAYGPPVCDFENPLWSICKKTMFFAFFLFCEKLKVVLVHMGQILASVGTVF
jgi:hypothetical protein